MVDEDGFQSFSKEVVMLSIVDHENVVEFCESRGGLNRLTDRKTHTFFASTVSQVATSSTLASSS